MGINKHTIQSEEFSFPGHTEYIEERLGNGNKSLMILMKNDFRVALVTTHIPVREIATTITKELIQEKLMIFHHSIARSKAPNAALPASGSGLENSTFTSSSVQFTTLKRLHPASEAVLIILKLVCTSKALR